MKREKLCGVYLWTNTVNDKKYVGCSVDIHGRWKQHIHNTQNGLRRKFNNAIRKYGESSFLKEIVEICDASVLKEREDYYIDFYDSIRFGYNVEKGYNTIANHERKKEICSAISEKAKKRRWIHNGERCLSVNEEDLRRYLDDGWTLGRLKFSKEHIHNLSESHKGYVMSEQTKRLCSWKGRHHSSKTRDMMSEKTIGRYTIEWYVNKYGIDEGRLKYLDHHVKKGFIKMNDGKITKLIARENVDEYLSKNWKIGKVSKLK